ncbi:methyltransferase [Legionella jordanis]|uniref:methyltransferase n=1 Tax=Legionella jordanis TaxID=456 RepID=UPI000EFE469A|nr:methyltransferase [Legionella jordanis]RMX21032.1 methyltransferase [Legionella jordanis]
MLTNSDNPQLQLAIMSRWYVVSRALHTIAQLGIANYMSTEPTEIHVLAEKTGTKAPLLERLLKFLSAYHVFKREGDCYALTDLSLLLRDDHPDSMREVLLMVDDSWWKAFSCMDAGLKTGITPFEHENGDDFFSYLAKHPKKQHNFDRGMAKLSTFDDAAIAKAFDFSKHKNLVDMGGGRGGLTKELAALYPSLKLILFDTEAVIGQLNPKNFPPQIQLLAGDFLKGIPKADAYLFKGVLHDFNDELMQHILKNCYDKMPASASLFIAEQVLPELEDPHPNKTMDIVMMVLLGGRQRSLKEWQDFVGKCGYLFEEAYETGSLFLLMKFKPNK